MNQGQDTGDLFHGYNKLIKPGIADTEMVTREYQFTADNELDAKTNYGCTSTGTKTITPLPSNTIAMHFSINIRYANFHFTGISFKRQSTDTNTHLLYFGHDGALSGNEYATYLVWVPTNGNQFYISALFNQIDQFLIVGYKVKE